MRFLAIYIVSALFTFGFFTNCKKVTTKVNSEKSFILFFADKDSGLLKDQCFDQVYGLNNSPLKSCSNSLTGLELPLNITDTISTFIFLKDSQTDTIKITYKKFHRIGTGEYEVRFDLKRIDPLKSRRFDSLSTSCTPEISTYCNGDQNLFAVIYL